MKKIWEETMRLNELKESNRKVAFTVRIRPETYRRLLEKAREAGMESQTFFEKVLEERL